LCLAAYLVSGFFLKPPKESQDWAAWVQAFGSIGAIIGSVSIVHWQTMRKGVMPQRIKSRSM
jgi:hypothetical protein